MPRGSGRPFKKGKPRAPGAGRKKGTPNKTAAEVRHRIETEADPVGFFIKVARGEPFKAGTGDIKNPSALIEWRPTPEQIERAHRWLGNKLIADVRAVEISTPEDKVLEIKIVQ